MAVQLQTYTAQVGLQPANVPRVSFDTSIGEGLQSVGNAISAQANRADAMKRQKDRLNASLGLDALNANLEPDFQRVQQEAPADGSDIEKNYMEKYVNPKTAAYLATIKDPELKAEFQQRVETFKQQHANQANDTEYKIGNAHSVDAVKSFADNAGRAVVAQPTNYDNVIADLEQKIDDAPLLTAAQREDMKQKLRAAMPAVLAETLQAQDPQTLRFASGLGTLQERSDYLARHISPVLSSAIGQLPDKDLNRIAKELGDETPKGLSDIGRRSYFANKDVIAAYGQAFFKDQIVKHGGDARAAIVATVGKKGEIDDYLKDGAAGLSDETRSVLDRVTATLGTKMFASGRGNEGGNSPTAAQLIRGFEGFRETPYWDVNHHRVGYGSDTVTMPDGSVVSVRPGMKVSRADADRDLNRRVGEFQNGVIADIGADAWGKLSEGAKAALTSVAYNYGALPKKVVAAAKTGDRGTIANSIISLAGQNAGVNAKRRRQEAAVVLGEALPTGAATGGTGAGGGGSYGGSSSPAAPYVAPQFAGMSGPALLDVQGKVTAELNKAAAESKAALDTLKYETKSAADNDIASILQTGRGTIPTMQMEQFQQNLLAARGADAVLAWSHDRAKAGMVYQYSQDFADKSDAEIDSMVKSLEPKGGAGAADQQDIHDQVAKKAAEVKSARAADPADFVMRHNPEVLKAWQAFDPNNPDTGRAAVSRTIDAQINAGVPFDKIAPLPDAQANTVAKAVINPEVPVDARLKILAGTIAMTDNPEHQRAIFHQLVKAGVPDKAEVAIDAVMRNDMGAARRMFEAAVIKPENLPKGAREPKFDDAVEAALLGDGTPGQAFYNLDLHDPVSAAMAQRDFELAKTATAINMGGGLDQATAIAQAVKDIHGPVARLDVSLADGGHVSGILPDTVDPGAVTAGMEKALPAIRGELIKHKHQDMSAFDSKTGDSGDAVIKAAGDYGVDLLMTEGVFRNYGQGWGFFNPHDNTFVADINGKPMTWTTDELIAMGKPEQDVKPPSGVPVIPAQGAQPEMDPRLKAMGGQ